MPTSATPPDAPIQGSVLAFFAFDIGFQVDLDAAAPLVREATRRRVVRARRPAPTWFDYSPAPVHLVLDCAPVTVGDHASEPTVEAIIYDFGAALITFRLPLPERLADLPAYSAELRDNGALLAGARERAEHVIETMRPAIERPRLSDAVEDYVVFAVTAWDADIEPATLLGAHRPRLAAVLEAETAGLSDQQIGRVTEGAMSYAPGDLALIDWNASILFDPAPDDVIAVLQHANIELLELRILDQELDAILDHADETLSMLTRKRVWPVFASSRMLRRFASAQTDAAVMFEGVNNAIKLLGNQYLARLYRLAAVRLDLPAWQASVQRKLEATDSLYAKISDATSIRRLETLEWVIIVLIALSMLLPFTPWYH